MAVGLGDVNLVVDASGGVEVEGVVLEAHALLVAAAADIEQQQVVAGLGHGVHPLVVAHLQVAQQLAPGHAQHAELVFKAIELEHVGHGDGALADFRVERQGGVQRDVGTGDLQLQLMDEVGEGRIAEIAVAGAGLVGKGADAALHKGLDAVYVGLEMGHHLLVHRFVTNVDYLAFDVFVHHLAALVGQRDGGLGQILHIARGIDAEHVVARGAFQH